jgi:membrane protein YqaA with SNARE-associated domain
MKGFLARLDDFALALGGPGLFVVAFLDSSFLSLPQINDLLVILMVIQHPERMAYYAAMATLGSMTGCFVLYFLARKGGEVFLRRRFHERHIERGLALVRRHGLLAVLVPAILPPPSPFKIFVLLAGVSRVSPARFGAAVATGRGFRYFGEGLLAVWYGEQAMDFLRENGRGVALGVAAVVLVGGVAYGLLRRRRRELGRAAGDHP